MLCLYDLLFFNPFISNSTTLATLLIGFGFWERHSDLGGRRGGDWRAPGKETGDAVAMGRQRWCCSGQPIFSCTRPGQCDGSGNLKGQMQAIDRSTPRRAAESGFQQG